jgi:hypothetical protein
VITVQARVRYSDAGDFPKRAICHLMTHLVASRRVACAFSRCLAPLKEGTKSHLTIISSFCEYPILSMPAASDDCALPGITVLPPTTVRQIGSSQVLVDPSSVVKELIDNALDARAKSVFVDIAANTLDSIQVKDDGHGIPSEDRALACRRYCTSKIRDFQDLKTVGGKWLGFRGEALASVAEMSGTLAITTRVEGEPVAVKLNYHRNGELASWSYWFRFPQLL